MAAGRKHGSAPGRKLSGYVTFREIYINNKLKPTSPPIHLCLHLMQSKSLVAEEKKATPGRWEGDNRDIYIFQIVNWSNSHWPKHPTTRVILKSMPCRENVLRYVNRHVIWYLNIDALQCSLPLLQQNILLWKPLFMEAVWEAPLTLTTLSLKWKYIGNMPLKKKE